MNQTKKNKIKRFEVSAQEKESSRTDASFGVTSDFHKDGNQEITAAYIGIGNELLSGSTRDTNFVYLARTLHELGIRLMRSVIIPDDLDAIQEALKLCRRRFTYIFTSGGLGPTHDDVTVEGVARALGVRIVRHPLLEEKLQPFYKEGGNDAVLRMADVPEGAELHFFENLFIPVCSIENIYLLPGVPELFKLNFDAIKERFRTEPYYTAEIFSERFETDIAELLSETLQRFPPIKIGSYPNWDQKDYSVKIVVESKEEGILEEAAAYLRKVLS